MVKSESDVLKHIETRKWKRHSQSQSKFVSFIKKKSLNPLRWRKKLKQSDGAVIHHDKLSNH